jgi:hypothetical protein
MEPRLNLEASYTLDRMTLLGICKTVDSMKGLRDYYNEMSWDEEKQAHLFMLQGYSDEEESLLNFHIVKNIFATSIFRLLASVDSPNLNLLERDLHEISTKLEESRLTFSSDRNSTLLLFRNNCVDKLFSDVNGALQILQEKKLKATAKSSEMPIEPVNPLPAENQAPLLPPLSSSPPLEAPVARNDSPRSPRICKIPRIVQLQNSLFDPEQYKHPGIYLFEAKYGRSNEVADNLDAKQIQNLNVQFSRPTKAKEILEEKWLHYQKSKKHYEQCYSAYSKAFDATEQLCASTPSGGGYQQPGMPPKPPVGGPPPAPGMPSKSSVAPMGIPENLAAKRLCQAIEKNTIAKKLVELSKKYQKLQEATLALKEEREDLFKLLFIGEEEREMQLSEEQIEAIVHKMSKEIDGLSQLTLTKSLSVSSFMLQSQIMNSPMSKLIQWEKQIGDKKKALTQRIRDLSNAEKALANKIKALNQKGLQHNVERSEGSWKAFQTAEKDEEDAQKTIIAVKENAKSSCSQIETYLDRVRKEIALFEQKFIDGYEESEEISLHTSKIKSLKSSLNELTTAIENMRKRL